jgi:protein ImuA
MNSAPQSSGNHVDLSAGRPLGMRGQLVDGLRRQLGRWEAASAVEEANLFSCGVTAIDRLLPGGGLRHGMLVEWVTVNTSIIKAINQLAPGSAGGSRYDSARKNPGRAGGCSIRGAATLGLLAAREACRQGGALVVIDRRQTFYPPAAAAWGIELERLIVVHPQNARDELWAAVQALRSPAVAAMWAAIDRLDSRAFRRLQLAAQGGRTLGVLVRPARARAEPSWADVTLGVGSRVESQESRARIPALDSRPLALDLSRRVRVQLVRCHSGRAGGSVVLEINDAAYTVYEAKEDSRLSAPNYRPSLLADG